MKNSTMKKRSNNSTKQNNKKINLKIKDNKFKTESVNWINLSSIPPKNSSKQKSKKIKHIEKRKNKKNKSKKYKESSKENNKKNSKLKFHQLKQNNNLISTCLTNKMSTKTESNSKNKSK